MGVLFDLVDPLDARVSGEDTGAYIGGDMLQALGLSAEAQNNVARLNDSGASFEQIADLIDRDADLDETLAEAVTQELKRIGQQLKKVNFYSPPYFLMKSAGVKSSVLSFSMA